MDRTAFFSAVRAKPFGGTISQSQVDGINNILDEWERRALIDLRWLAYMLATTFHETATRMQPIREMGSEAYLRSKPYYPWVGMGLVQVTWETNARKFGATKPEDLLSWPVALRALFDGMIKGMFTGRRLADYFNAVTEDWINARRIVNGTDRASLIAGYGHDFYSALQAAGASAPAPAPVPMPGPPKPVVTPVHVGIAAAAGAAATVAATKGTSIMSPDLMHYVLSDGIIIVAIVIALWVLHGKIATLLHLHKAAPPTVIVNPPAPPAPTPAAPPAPPAGAAK